MKLSDKPALILLGGAVIQTRDGPQGGPAAHRHRLALLALLALNPVPVSRDKLVAYLWPERDTEPSRNLLKTAVHELRKLLGEDAIRNIGDQLTLDRTAINCDVWAFEEAVERNDFETAAAAYAGPLLDGFFIKDTHEFDEWVEAQRRRLADVHARIVPTITSIPHVGLVRQPGTDVAATPVPSGVTVRAAGRIRRLRRPLLAIALLITTGAVIALNALSPTADAPATPVILPDEDPGTALAFNGENAHVSTPAGRLVTPRVDNIGFDMRVRWDGVVKGSSQMLFYHGHSGVTGWGLMVVGRSHGQPDGTLALLAGGITMSATSIVLDSGVWQQLSVERRDGRVTVSLGSKSVSVGSFPVNPVGTQYAGIERTGVGSGGWFDKPNGFFRGAIDRVRVRDLAASYWIDRWNFDEAAGATTVGMRGTVMRLVNAEWTPSGRLAPWEVFWQRIESLCGHAYAGRVAESSPGDSIMRRSPIAVHIRSCSPTEIRMPLHVGTDRSRTWVLTRTSDGLRLTHDHRHEDGSADAITGYGGATRDAGSSSRQEFFADARTASLIPAARTNVWTIEITPNQMFAYALRREGTDRRFRVEFGLPRQVATPPPPWGADR